MVNEKIGIRHRLSSNNVCFGVVWEFEREKEGWESQCLAGRVLSTLVYHRDYLTDGSWSFFFFYFDGSEKDDRGLYLNLYETPLAFFPFFLSHLPKKLIYTHSTEGNHTVESFKTLAEIKCNFLDFLYIFFFFCCCLHNFFFILCFFFYTLFFILYSLVKIDVYVIKSCENKLQIK